MMEVNGSVNVNGGFEGGIGGCGGGGYAPTTIELVRR